MLTKLDPECVACNFNGKHHAGCIAQFPPCSVCMPIAEYENKAWVCEKWSLSYGIVFLNCYTKLK